MNKTNISIEEQDDGGKEAYGLKRKTKPRNCIWKTLPKFIKAKAAERASLGRHPFLNAFLLFYI